MNSLQPFIYRLSHPGRRLGAASSGLLALGAAVFAFALPAAASADEPGTALVRHAPTLNARVEGSVHQMLPQGTTLNGNAAITGTLFVPGTPTVRLNGNPSFGGTLDVTGSTAPTNYQITLNGGSTLGQLVRRTDPVALPVVPAPSAPAGTRNVSLNNATDSPGAWATLRNLTLNSNAGTRVVPPGAYGDFTANGNAAFTLGVAGAAEPAIYHFQRLTLNGNSRLNVVGPVVVTLANSLNANGDLGAENHPAWLALNISNGGLTLNSNVTVAAYVTAPNGTVTINGGSRLIGGLIADRLTLNGNALLRLIARDAAPANQPPVAHPQSLATDEDVPLPLTLTGTDPDGDTLTYRILTLPAHGTLTLADGTPLPPIPQVSGLSSSALLFTSAANYHGPDSFTFLVNDGTADSAPVTVSITVHPVNDAPVAHPLAAELDADTTVLLTPSGTDVEGSPLTFAVATPPAHGSVTFDTQAGAFRYQPAANYHGPDRFTYTAFDGELHSAPAEVLLTVRPVNHAPVAHSAQHRTDEDTPLALTLTGTDPDGDPLTFAIVDVPDPAHGTLSFTAPAPGSPATATFTPVSDWHGTATFTFTVSDGQLTSAPALVTLVVDPVNDAPVAHPQSVAVSWNAPVPVTLAATDVDLPAGAALTYTIVTPPTLGTLTLADGTPFASYPHSLTPSLPPSLLYTPSGPAATGPDAFTFTASDGELTSAPATVSLTIAAPPAPPPPPALVFTAPANLGDPVNTPSLRLTGTLTGAAPFQLTVNGTAISLAAAVPAAPPAPAGSTSQTFDHLHTLPLEGPNALVIVATDSLGRQTTLTYTIDRITQAPALTLDHPTADRFATRVATIQLSGTVGASATTLTVNTSPVADFANGAYTHALALTPGDNLVTVEVRDTLGNTRTIRRTVVLDQTPPTFADLAPAPGFITRQPALLLTGRVVDGQSLTINDAPAPLAADGSFSATLTLTEGANTLALRAADAVGNVATRTLSGVLDTIAPALSLDAPLTGTTVAADSIAVSGTLDDPTATLTLNGTPLAHADGAFSTTFPLSAAQTTLTVTATDPAGNTTTRSATVHRDVTPPVVTFTAPAADALTRAPTIAVSGTLDDPTATVTINGRPATVSPGRFDLADFPLDEGLNTLVLLANDPLGNTSAPVTRTVTSDRTPPAAPALTAPRAYINADRVTLAGTAEPAARVAITGGLAPVQATADAAGSFNALVLLAPNQPAELILRATDPAGNEGPALVHTLVSDLVAPVITLTQPAPGATLTTATFEVLGTVTDTNPPSTLTIAGQTFPLFDQGRFAASLTLPNGPDQPIALSVTDLAGNTTNITRSVTIAAAPEDTQPPVIVVLSPAYDAPVPAAEITVTALVSDASPLASVTFNTTPVTASPTAPSLYGAPVTVDANGEFTITATDAHGLATTLTHRVLVDGDTPQTPAIQRVTPESPTAEAQVLLYATAAPGLRYEITGGLVALHTGTVAADGRITAAVPLHPNTTNTLSVRVLGANNLPSAAATIEVVHDSLPPTIVSTTPASGATGAPLADPVVIVFSEPIRAEDLAALAVRLGAQTLPVARALSADGVTATLTPSAPFAESVSIQVTVPATVRDLAGNPLGAAHTFTFTTLDATAPAAPVLDAAPARTHRLTLALSGSAEPLSRVEISGAAAPASVTIDAAGRFTLSVTLATNTLNTLSITARDAAGNVSTPTVLAVEHDATAFVLAATTPAATAADVPTDTALRLVFNKPVDPATIAGIVLVAPAPVPATVAPDSANPAELVLTLTPAAPLQAGRAYEIVIPADVADLFGNRLGATRRIAFTTTTTAGPAAPILYSATPAGTTTLTVATLTGFSTPGTRLLVSGGASDFEFPADGVIDTTGLFTLTVPLRTDAPNDIVLRARDASDRLSASVPALTVRQDSIPPTVVATNPVHGATAVSPQAPLFVEFSEAIQTASLSAAIPGIRLFDAQNAVVSGSWIPSADARSATFYPARALAADSAYKLLVGTTIRDIAGNPLPSAVAVDFTTAPATATNGARPAAPLLDPLPSNRTTATTVTLTGTAAPGATVRAFGGQGGGAATTTAAADGRFSLTVALVLNADNPLAVVAIVDDVVGDSARVSIRQVRHAAALRILSPQPGVEYHNRSVTVAGVIDDPESIASITVAGQPASIVGRYFFRQVILDEAPGAKSVTAIATPSAAGADPLTATVAFSLRVEPAGTDTEAPIPTFIFPEPGDVLNGEVVAAMLTVEEGVQLTHVEIDGVVAHEVVGNIFLIHAKLAEQGPNTLVVRATDAAGHVGTASVQVIRDSIGFATAPTVATMPSRTAERVVTVTGTAEPDATIVVLNGLVPVRVVVGPDGTFSVAVPLNPNAANTLYIVATDDAGNVSPVTTVAIAHDDTPPVIVSTSPAPGATGVPVNATIEIRFSEAIAPASVAPDSAVVLTSALGQAIQRNAVLSADGKTLRVTPAYKLLRGDTVTVELAASIADLHGFTLGAAHTFAFTTATYQTTVSGVVVDSQLRPLANVKVGLLGTELSQRTSSFGTFLLDDAPVGDRILYVDARPDVLTGLPPQGDARVFGYLEFLLPVRRDTDNTLGRPIFMVDTDFLTATPLAATGDTDSLLLAPRSSLPSNDLAGFSITYTPGAGRFADGSARGSLTATRIAPAHIPDRLPSGAIPHFLVELGPDDLVFATPARLTFPNAYDLPEGGEVIVFHFKYGVHDYTELGRATVGPDGLISTDAILQETGFIGIVPASGSHDLTRGYLEGRVVDAAGRGIAGVAVNAIAGSTHVVTDATGRYSIPLPDVRLELIRAYATVSTDLGARRGESPSLVFPSALVALKPSGVTPVPDIVVDSFFLGGSIRYQDTNGGRIPVTGLAYDGQGRLSSVDDRTVRAVEIMVYRRLATPGALWEYDSEPYLRTVADLDRLDDTYDASFSLAFLGSLNTAAPGAEDDDAATGAPRPGDIVKLVAFDRQTGFYGETDLKIPSAAETAGGGEGTLDVIANLELRPPLLRLDMNRVFFLDGVRRRANIPHRGIAFTRDEYVEFNTTWTTPVATPLARPELTLAGRLRVNSIGYQTDHAFPVRGGTHARVLELREGIYADRLAVLQRETDVGIERLSVSPDGSFAPASLIPIEVTTTAYGLAQAPTDVTETTAQQVELNILDLALSAATDGLDVSGRTLPGGTINIGGTTLTADANGFFGARIPGALGAGGVGVQVGDSLTTRFGETLAPVINDLDATPPGLAPSRGAQGDLVLIHGAHFSPVADDNKVSFNGAVALVEAASETRLTVRVPELASSGDVTVTIAGKRSNAVRFEFLSIGINNGSFEDGTLRAWTLEGSGRVVERWKRVEPTHRQFMAFLDTMSDPRDGLSTLTSDEFEVPEGMQTLLFDYNFLATALVRPLAETLFCELLVDNQTIPLPHLFADARLDFGNAATGFALATGFRTVAVPVDAWAGTGRVLRVRVTLLGRGPLPERMPDTDRFDANPVSWEKQGGTGVLLDGFRLSAAQGSTPPSLVRSGLVAELSGGVVVIRGLPETLPTGARAYVRCLLTGRVAMADVDQTGAFEVTVALSRLAARGLFHVSYATAEVGGAGRSYSSPLLLEVRR